MQTNKISLGLFGGNNSGSKLGSTGQTAGGLFGGSSQPSSAFGQKSMLSLANLYMHFDKVFCIYD